MSTGLTICAALRVEARAARSALPAARVEHVGMRARDAELDAVGGPVALIGFGGGLDPAISVGAVVVASSIRTSDGAVIECAGGDVLVAALTRAGLRVHLAPIAGSSRIVHGRARAALAVRTGAAAVDMESAVVGRLIGDRPLAVVRVIVDTPRRRIARASMITDGLRAYRTLREVARALPGWALLAAQVDSLVDATTTKVS